MSDSRALKILATAPLRGPGLDALRSLGEVVEEPWITGPTAPMRLLGADDLAARHHRGRRRRRHLRGRQLQGPGARPARSRAICSTRGDPTNVDVAGATAKGIPVLRAPGRNADGVAELAVALLLACTRGLAAGRRRRARRRGVPRRHDPLPALPGVAGRRRDRRRRRLRRRRAGRGVALRRARHARAQPTTRSPPTPPTTTSTRMLPDCDVVSMHAAVTPETLGLMDAERFAPMREGAVYVNTARAALHDLDALTAALAVGPPRRRRARPLRGRGARRPATRCSPMDNVVLTPHIGGATYDTEANHTSLIADGLAALLAGERPDQPRQPGGRAT